jgi:activating signal cointegrator complex subunit 1
MKLSPSSSSRLVTPPAATSSASRDFVGKRHDKKKNKTFSRPALTHFISLPLGHHEELRRRASALTDSWLGLEPCAAGLDPSIVIPPRRLHLTLAVMALDSPSSSVSRNGGGDRPNPTAGTGSPTPPSPPARTLERAKQVLDSCVQDVNEILNRNGGTLRLTLDRLGSFQSNWEQCHVLFAEPRDADDSTPGLLREVGGE